MRKILPALLLAFSIATTLQAQVPSRTEFLGRPTDNSVTIKMFFTDSVDVYAEYGSSPGAYTGQTNTQTFAADSPVVISITGLQPDTKYYYRVQCRRTGSSNFSPRPEYFFHTQRSVGSTFSFVVQADPHVDANSDTALYRLCLKNQLEDTPDFMIDLGDFLMTDKLKDVTTNQIPHDTIPYRCDLLRSFYETSAHSVPVFIALGNHEGEAGWNLNGNGNNIAVWDAQERKKYFLNPQPNGFYSGDTANNPFIGKRENYYAWHWGDALFVVLDPYWYTNAKPDSLNGWRWTLGKTQYDWLKQTLETSSAKFKFVFAHQLIGGDPQGRGGVEYADKYEWGGDNLDGTPGFSTNRPGWYKPIKDLLTENHVNIFFHGHDHLYDQQVKDCLVYQETPQPSLPNFNSTSASAYGYVSGQILNNSGHLRVTVSPNGTTVEYVRAYLPASENSLRHNKDVSATYFIGATNCYDSITTGVPVLWNSNYSDELIYPNPFASETEMQFNIKKTEQLSLFIFDLNGQIVRKLIDGSEVPAGKFQILWDGKDGKGNQLANGTYFIKIIGGQDIEGAGFEKSGNSYFKKIIKQD